MRFISAKYMGGSGCPASTSRTNASSSSVVSPQFAMRSYPIVDCGIAPSALPHAEPAPCPGQSCTKSGSSRMRRSDRKSACADASIVPAILRRALEQIGTPDVADEHAVT